MPDITITLSTKQAQGIKWAVDKANEQIVLDNAAIQERNAVLEQGEVAEVPKTLYTNKTYVEFVMGTAADSYLASAGNDIVATRRDKLAALDATKLAQVDAILG